MDAECSNEDGFRTGLARSVLAEIGERLTVLVATGEAAAIDLLSLPMTAVDRAELETLLGHGEVDAALEIAGPTQVRETGYAGVWWIRHFGAGDRIACDRIEITARPDLLASHSDDIAAAAARLRQDLAEEETAGHV